MDYKKLIIHGDIADINNLNPEQKKILIIRNELEKLKSGTKGETKKILINNNTDRENKNRNNNSNAYKKFLKNEGLLNPEINQYNIKNIKDNYSKLLREDLILINRIKINLENLNIQFSKEFIGNNINQYIIKIKDDYKQIIEIIDMNKYKRNITDKFKNLKKEIILFIKYFKEIKDDIIEFYNNIKNIKSMINNINKTISDIEYLE